MKFSNFAKSALSGSCLALLLSVSSVITSKTCLAQSPAPGAAPTTFTAYAPSYAVPAGAIYVSPTGSPTGLGTAASPISLAVAPTKVQNGSTLVLRGGTYRGVSELGLSFNNLTIQNYPGEAVWLTGDIDVSTGWVTETLAGGRVIWRKDSWNYSFPSNLSSIYIDPAYPAAGLNDLMTRNGVPLTQVATKDAVVANTFFVDSVNKRLYVGTQPAGTTLAATMSKRAISIWDGVGETGYPYSGNGTKVRGLNFRNFATEAILIGAPNVTIENCQSVWNGMQGLSVAYNNRVNSGVTLRGCRFSSNGIKGVAAYRVNGLTVESCIFDHNNVERFSVAHDAAAIKFVACRGTTFRENSITENYANGAWFDVSCLDTKAYYNIIKSNTKGMFFEVSHNGWLAFNLLQGNATGITVAGSSATRVYNNTLVNNRNNIEVLDDGRINNTTIDTPLNQGSQPDGNPLEPGENDEEAAMGATWLCRSNTFRNNLMWETSGDAHYKADWTARNEATSLMISASDHNAFGAQASTPNTYKWNLGNQQFRIYSTLAAFKTANPSFEAGSMQKSVVNSVNPYFVNASSGDFRLQENSEAVNAGAALPTDIATELGTSVSPQHIGAMMAYIRPRVIQTSERSVIADAFVRDGNDIYTNFGTSSALEVKRDATVGYSRQTVLRFSVASIPGNVQSVKLRLYGTLTSATEAYVNAYKVGDDTWPETGVNWYNSPVTGAFASQTRIAGTAAKYYEWDVTQAALDSIGTDGLMSLKLICDATGTALATFNSKEHITTSTRPALVIQSSVPVDEVTPPPTSWNGS